METVRIQPVDVLYLRGNRAFSDANAAEALMPPWPSLFAGALRARMIEDAGAARRFRAHELDGALGAVVGAGPQDLGSFRVASVCLERPRPEEGHPARAGAKSSSRELLFPAPADLVISEHEGKLQALRSTPTRMGELGIQSGHPLASTAVLRAPSPSKPVSGCWLTQSGMAAYLAGATPGEADLVRSGDLWKEDDRLGIALDSERRTAKEGLLYTTQTVAMASGVAFVVGVRGSDGALPRSGLLRLGGDGRGATVEAHAGLGEVGAKVPQGDRFTIVLATPGLFPEGWQLPGMRREGDGWVLALGGLKAKVVCAAVSRGEVISGWDLAQHRPKPARRSAPTGSVYWLEHIEGSARAELGRLVEEGLWQQSDTIDRQRQAEGFNNIWLGEWAKAEE